MTYEKYFFVWLIYLAHSLFVPKYITIVTQCVLILLWLLSYLVKQYPGLHTGFLLEGIFLFLPRNVCGWIGHGEGRVWVFEFRGGWGEGGEQCWFELLCSTVTLQRFPVTFNLLNVILALPVGTTSVERSSISSIFLIIK